MELFTSEERTVEGVTIQVNPFIFEAINTSIRKNSKYREFGLGEHEDSLFSEITDGNDITMVQLNKKQKQLKQFKIDSITRYASANPFGSEADNVAVCLLMLHYLQADEGDSRLINAIQDIEDFYAKPDATKVPTLALSYIAAEQSCLQVCNVKGGMFAQTSNDVIQELNFTQVEAGLIGPSITLMGKFSGFVKHQQPVKLVDAKDFIGKYYIDSERVFTDEEREHLLQIPEHRTVSTVAAEITEQISKSFQRPPHLRITNILLEGATGTGKTIAAKDIAAGLGLPYGSFCCFGDMDTSRIFGEFLPEMDDDINEPDPDMIELDPAGCYEQVTGKTLTDEEAMMITPEEVIAAIHEAKENQNHEFKVKFYRNVFLDAIEKGWVLEIQEPTVVSDPAILMALNSVLEKDGILSLSNKTIKRHPQCIIIMTTNRNYEGCRPLNQALRDRMDLCVKVEMPPDDEIIQRLERATGCTDEGFLRAVVESAGRISEFLDDRGINTHVSSRTLESFVINVMDGYDVLDCIRKNIIYKITTEDEDVAAIENFIELSTPLMNVSL